MPKRIPTPPPGDDEPRYLTVAYPYAISGTCNMELQKDREDFARWVACCIDKDAFFAIFHKPSSRAMVIIEVKRDYPHFDRILGEHRWSEFLQKPSKEEIDRVTQVFYCTYNTGRTVQKNGWKRIDVDETWFKSWSPRNRQIKYPYPPTRFCDVPIEDRTNLAMCRPLPGAVKPVPLPEDIAPPVVGSVEWIQSRGGASSAPVGTPSKPDPLGAWRKGAPPSAKPNPTAGGNIKKTTGISQGSQTGTRMPAVGGGPIAVKSSNVWQTTSKKPTSAPVATNWEDSPPVSGVNTPVLREASPSAGSRNNAWYTHPPGLTLSSSAPSSAQGGPDRAGNFSASSWDSAAASTPSPDSDSGPDLTSATESDNPYAVQIHFSESTMEEEFHGMRIRAIEDDDGELRGLDTMAPLGAARDEPVNWEAVTAAGWDDDPADAVDAEDLWRQGQNTEAPKQTLCKAHGNICKKGICAEYAAQKRAEEAAKRRAEAAANRGKKGGAGRGGKGRGARKNNDDREGPEKGATQNNANANANPHRGPGAPVKSNWRGAVPRAIITAEAVEKQEATKVTSDDGWGNTDPEAGPNMTAALDAASNASWDVSENAYDPWAPSMGRSAAGGSKPQGKKKPGQTNPSTNWADEVDAELGVKPAIAADPGEFTTVPKRSKRGRDTGPGSTTSWATSTKPSSGGWGSVPDMP